MTPSTAAYYPPTPRVGESSLNPPDGVAMPEPEHALCCICHVDGYLFADDGDWRENDHYDRGLDIPTGAPLETALPTPDGRWACSSPCYSQAMYIACEDKEALDAVAAALQTLSENVTPKTIRFLNTWAGSGLVGGNYSLPTFALLTAAEEISAALSQKSEPAWLDRADEAA